MIKKILFLFLLSTTIIAQSTNYDSLITAGINQIYNIKFKKAEATFLTVQKEFPQKPAGKFFEAMIDWWRITLNPESKKYDNIFIKKLDATIEFCDKILDKNPNNVDAIFFKGGALGFRGRLHALRKDFFKAALDAKEALPLVNRAYKLNPKNKDVILGFGIYNYYAAEIPKQYPFIKPFMIFFPGGNTQKGLQQLKIVAKEGKYAKIEATFFLLTLYYRYEKNYDEALKYAKILVRKFPDNPLFLSYYGRIYVRKNDYLTAGKIFLREVKKCDEGLPGFGIGFKREADYYVGMKYKLENKIDSAIVYFKDSEKLSRILDKKKVTGFLINSVLYLGMFYDQLGYRNLAIEKYKEVLKLKEFWHSHEQAKKYLKHPYKK